MIQILVDISPFGFKWCLLFCCKREWYHATSTQLVWKKIFQNVLLFLNLNISHDNLCLRMHRPSLKKLQNVATFHISLIQTLKREEEPPASFVGIKILWFKNLFFFPLNILQNNCFLRVHNIMSETKQFLCFSNSNS